MKVIRLPGPSQSDRAGLLAGEEIDAMLAGEVGGAESLAVRALREDVRGLAAPISAEFEAELQARVAEWGRAGRARPVRRLARDPRTGGAGPTFNARLARARGRLTDSPARLLGAGGAAAAVIVAVVAGLIAASGGFSSHGTLEMRAHVNAGTARTQSHVAKTSQSDANAGSSASAGPALAAPTEKFSTTYGEGLAKNRLQQLAASVALATEPANVQSAAEATTRLAVSDGGYVESSHVQVRTGGASEAELHLVIPSARLSSAIAALGRIAPERAVNQESEDITSAYDSAKRRLGDAEAVRRALLRALEAATTQGQIDSLREQLASNRSQIAEYRSQVHGEEHRAATSKLEVTIAGAGARAAGSIHEGLTLRRGLRDAGHVLAGAGAVALIALAVLVPLALVAIALGLLRAAWLRRRREGVLDA